MVGEEDEEEDNRAGGDDVKGTVTSVGNAVVGVVVSMDILISSCTDCNRGNNSAKEYLSSGVAFQHLSIMILL